MGELRGETECRTLLIDAVRIGFLREHNAKSEIAEEPPVEREAGVGHERTVEPHGWPGVRLDAGRRVAEETPLALYDQIEAGGVDAPVVQLVVIAVADSAERKDLFIDFDTGNLAGEVAPVAAAVAGERAQIAHFAAGQVIEVEDVRLKQSVVDAAFDLEGHAEGAHQSGLGRHDDRLAGQGGHGDGDGFVVADPALHEDLPPYRAVAFHAIGVIHADRVNQSGDDVRHGHAFLGGAFDVRADEGGALVVEIWRRLALKRGAADLGHRDAEAFLGGFLEEGAGARAARFVHGVIGGHAVGDVGVLGVLPANFEDGVDFGVEMQGAGGVGDDFVDDAAGECVKSRDLASGPGHAQANDVDGGLKLGGEACIDPARRTDGVAVGAQVLRGQDGLVAAAHHDALGGGGPDIEPHDGLVAGLGPPPGMLAKLDLAPVGIQGFEERQGRPAERHDGIGAGDGSDLVFQGPYGRAQCLEPRGRFRDAQVADAFPQVMHHGGVPAAAANEQRGGHRQF